MIVSGKTNEEKSKEKTSEERLLMWLTLTLFEREDRFTELFSLLYAPSDVYSVKKSIFVITFTIHISSGNNRGKFKVVTTSVGNQLEVEYRWSIFCTDVTPCTSFGSRKNKNMIKCVTTASNLEIPGSTW